LLFRVSHKQLAVYLQEIARGMLLCDRIHGIFSMDKTSGGVQEGATWIYDNVARLAAFGGMPYSSAFD